MTEYQIQPNSRQCFVSGKELLPGEAYYSALLEEGDHFVRRDYSRDAWQGPPEGAFSFWLGSVPTGDRKPKPRFDDDLLMECFQRLDCQTDPGRVNFRYIVALLLFRRKRLKLEDSVTEDGQDKMIASCVRTSARFEVINPKLSEEDLATVQEEVFQVLGWD